MSYEGKSVIQLPELESVRRLRESAEGGPGSGPRPHGGRASQRKKGEHISDFISRIGPLTKSERDAINKRYEGLPKADRTGLKKVGPKDWREWTSQKKEATEGGPGSGPRPHGGSSRKAVKDHLHSLVRKGYYPPHDKMVASVMKKFGMSQGKASKLVGDLTW